MAKKLPNNAPTNNNDSVTPSDETPNESIETPTPEDTSIPEVDSTTKPAQEPDRTTLIAKEMLTKIISFLIALRESNPKVFYYGVGGVILLILLLFV